MFKTIKENASAEIVEKKSKFIGNIFYIENEQEAEKKIKEIRKKYHDARHNCFAYKIENPKISRFSDDGEPSGTAGNPILSVIEGNNLSNILIIVTRYFGGILLGTGGLVRAYSDCANKVIKTSQIIEKELGVEAKIVTTYKNLEKIKYYLQKNHILVTNSEYLENVVLTIEISKQQELEIKDKIDKKELEIENIEKIQERYIIKM